MGWVKLVKEPLCLWLEITTSILRKGKEKNIKING
jgi:hypothetical protein